MFSKKEPEKISKFRELWRDKRFRSLIFLGFWIVFAVVIVAAYRPLYNSNVETYREQQKSEVNSSVMNNYSYSLLDTKDSKISVITGKEYGNYNLFNINGVEYYYNGKVYKLTTPITEVPLSTLGYLKITPKMINNMVERSQVLETDKYSLPLIDFITLYNASELNNIDATKLQNKNVLIDVYKKDGLFYKVDMNITEYIKLKEPNIKSDILTFNYTNVNEVEDFTKEYESRVQK